LGSKIKVRCILRTDPLFVSSAMNSVLCPVSAPLASSSEVSEDKTVKHGVTVPLSDNLSMAKMVRKTLEVIPLIDSGFPKIVCCSSPPVAQTDELLGGDNGNCAAVAEVEEEVHAEEDPAISASGERPWALKPSVGTWLLPTPLYAKEEVQEAKAQPMPGMPAKSPEPIDVETPKGQQKGSCARARSCWFRCVKASATEPRKVKA